MTLERDSRLGRYVIRARIGVGGMGAVYRAYDTVLKRQVAIKTILADKTTDREYLARFRREALAISQLEDPHIVTLLDFVEGNLAQGEPPYMVMELLRGQDLQSIIAKGPMPIDRAVDILLEVCAAVGACHRHGFVHRDLKGTNVFITEYNAIETAKVLDFGVAKVWNEAAVAQMADDLEVTRQGVAVGTPSYLAPEILRGGAATPATDQYALGILLYSALTGGRKPFELQKNGEFRDLHLMRAIMKGDHPPPRTYRKDIPEGLEAVIERAIDREADRRYSSVHALGEALLEWASPRGRLHWTGHFTKAPPKAAPVQSMAVPPETVLQARGGTAVDSDRSPAPATVPLTRPVDPREIHELPGLEKPKHTATTKTWDEKSSEPRQSMPAAVAAERGIPMPRGPDQPAAAAAILLNPGENPAVLLRAAPELATRPSSNQVGVGQRRRGPVLILWTFVGAVAIGAALYLGGVLRLPRLPSLSAAPVTAGPPATSPRPSAPVPQAPAMPTPSPSKSGPTAVLPPSNVPTETEGRPESPEKQPKPRRHRKPTVDENGIGIPAN
jgi:serine/threonine-protein kinase